MASYRKRGKKGTWDYRVFDNSGNVIAFGSGFRTKKEAMYEAQAIEQKKTASGGSVFQSNATLFEMWQEWYDLIIAPSDLVELTKSKYRSRGQELLKYFGDKPARSITHSLYQRFINEYGSRVLRQQVSRMNSDVSKVIKLAKRDGALLNDFTDGVKLVGDKFRKRIEDKYLHSISDYKAMLDYLRTKFDSFKSTCPFLLYFMFKTGMRVGEAMAVCWEDLDFEKGFVYTYRRYAGDLKEFCDAKTPESIRYVPLSKDVVIILKYLKGLQEEYLSERGIENPNNMVFFGLFGVPTNTALNKYLRSCLRALDIPIDMSATGTRHTYGSYLIAMDVDIWVISKILGHKDTTQIIKTYGHLLREKIQNGYDEVKELLIA